jgi:hypothetical protein
METIGYPTLLALLFAGSFILFLKFVPPQANPKFVLPTTKNARLIQERRRLIQQQRQAAAEQQNRPSEHSTVTVEDALDSNNGEF